MSDATSWLERVRQWFARDTSMAPPPPPTSAVDRASSALRDLLQDPLIPAVLRTELADDFNRIEALLDKLARDELHVAVFGRVSVGKSALANALLGHAAFETGVLHGTTTKANQQRWTEAGGSGLHLIDTPGINELDGESRERLAFEVAEISDLVIFVVDGDMTQSERDALAILAKTERPIVLALNKSDRYTSEETERLLRRLREHTVGCVHADNVIACAAQPADRRVIDVDAHGREHERCEARPAEVAELRARLLAVCEREGKTLSALNASLFAGRLSDQVARRLAETRREIADRLIGHYCLAKGIAVALNPIPVADLLAAAALDAALVMHLGKVYGLPLTRREAGQLIATICAQLAALMGAIWGVHLVASALKGASAGLSTVMTAGAQGALAWYATQLVGRAAERYLVAGKSWGEQGPKRVVQDIVASLDRDSILREAREEILARLRKPS
ncbi:GTP-binding protein [Tahibacter amnicola]|uniref:GTP-binding protein n=1 Tax=Tahibacter amnicola TaxID=2976241 RepID=A0ABY6BLQ9_9GAMM|nr:GTP-binding protein [Tahibacter amnicola]UXI69325.1 GTP-binding protein [Tahibacter amnicola]